MANLDAVIAWFKSLYASAIADLAKLVGALPADIQALNGVMAAVEAVLTVFFPGVALAAYIADVQTWVTMAENLVVTALGITMPAAEAANIAQQAGVPDDSTPATGAQAMAFVTSRAMAKYTPAYISTLTAKVGGATASVPVQEAPYWLHMTYAQNVLTQVRVPLVKSGLAMRARRP